MVSKVHYVGFWKRALADCLDSFLLDLITFCLFFLLLFIFSGFEFKMKLFDSVWVQFWVDFIRASLALIYFGWGAFYYGTTFGKKKLGFCVKSWSLDGGLTPLTLKQSILRCLGYLPSYLFFGLGFLMVIVHPEKKALHDYIAGSVSVMEN
jgi:uncharacterized RDD family membrane protein YckC